MKIFCVTGANRGIGLELVRQLSAREEVEKIYALCRQAGDDLQATDKIQVIEQMDVSDDGVVEKLKNFFRSKSEKPLPIDCLIHNAGAFAPREKFDGLAAMLQSQSLSEITMERMRFAFELNTLGPLRVTQALLPNIKQKVIIITSLMGSMSDNTSGGIYAYRTSKAAVNMVGKSLAEDLKKEGISVGLVHPGAVLTGFGNSEGKDWDSMQHPGQRGVVESTRGVLDAIDKVTIENTGVFLHGNYGEGIKELAW